MKKKRLIIFLLLVVLSVSIIHNSKKITITKAEGDPNPPGSPAWCADHCNPSPETNPCNQSETSKYADCCLEIAKTGDPFACGWPDRGFCLDSQCASIPEGVVRQRCGGPKHSWCNMCRDNKCPGYGVDNISPTKAPTVAPTSISIPTTPPTSIPIESGQAPTNPPTGGPTKPYNRTGENLDTQVERSNQNNLSPLSLFQLPQINLLDLPKININIVDLNKASRKPLGLLEFLFKKITVYDKKLELTINEAFRKLIPSSE